MRLKVVAHVRGLRGAADQLHRHAGHLREGRPQAAGLAAVRHQGRHRRRGRRSSSGRQDHRRPADRDGQGPRRVRRGAAPADQPVPGLHLRPARPGRGHRRARHHQHPRAVGHRAHPRGRPAPRRRPVAPPAAADGPARGGGRLRARGGAGRHDGSGVRRRAAARDRRPGHRRAVDPVAPAGDLRRARGGRRGARRGAPRPAGGPSRRADRPSARTRPFRDRLPLSGYGLRRLPLRGGHVITCAGCQVLTGRRWGGPAHAEVPPGCRTTRATHRISGGARTTQHGGATRSRDRVLG